MVAIAPNPVYAAKLGGGLVQFDDIVEDFLWLMLTARR
jgi:hypothetical protein